MKVTIPGTPGIKIFNPGGDFTFRVKWLKVLWHHNVNLIDESFKRGFKNAGTQIRDVIKRSSHFQSILSQYYECNTKKHPNLKYLDSLYVSILLRSALGLSTDNPKIIYLINKA